MRKKIKEAWEDYHDNNPELPSQVNPLFTHGFMYGYEKFRNELEKQLNNMNKVEK